MREIMIEMRPEDFERLTETTMRWAGGGWNNPDQIGRWEPVDVHAADDTPSWDWTWIHWFGDNWASIVLARSYLAAYGHTCEILHDTAEHQDGRFLGYVMLTDYNPTPWAAKWDGNAVAQVIPGPPEDRRTLWRRLRG